MTAGGSVDFTLMRHLGNLGFVYAANLLFGQRFTDLCYGYCAFWKRDLNALKLTADGFEIEMELILSAIKANLSIVEVPSVELQRRFGDSNLNAWTDGKRVLKTMIKERFSRLSHRVTAPSAITIIATLMPAHNSQQWLPAGSDTRSWDQRAGADTLMPVMIAATTDQIHTIPAHTATTAPTRTPATAAFAAAPAALAA